ncbi:MAG: hypothetical protein IJU18_00230 [Oscillospiraceae bacterium]|nr:hypothetical protein [Oscillospiraceae bacterium]
MAVSQGKRGIILLALLTLLLTLPGCGEQTPPANAISWKQAFMTEIAPDGYAMPDKVAFYTVKSGVAQVDNMTWEEIDGFLTSFGSLPRSRQLEDRIPAQFGELLKLLDYAVYNGYCKICVPTTQWEGSEVFSISKLLEYMYRLNAGGVTARTISSFRNAAGETVRYVYISISGLDMPERPTRYAEAIQAARQIVASVPEDYDEYETALYLYRYLTDNVTYDNDDYYGDEWDLLYDALVLKKTVCAGYGDALYVLYNLAGIDCVVLEGYVYDDDPADDDDVPYNGGHAWNAACLGGKYYEFDSTWDSGYLPAEYLFFAVSEADLQKYYPRMVYALTDGFCPERNESLFPLVNLEDDSVEFFLLRIYYHCWNLARYAPEALMDFLRVDGSLRGTVSEAGYAVSQETYDLLYSAMSYYFSDELITAALDGYITVSGAEPKEPVDTDTYRLCSVEDDRAVVYACDANGRLTPADMIYEIGSAADHYYLAGLRAAGN